MNWSLIRAWCDQFKHVEHVNVDELAPPGLDSVLREVDKTLAVDRAVFRLVKAGKIEVPASEVRRGFSPPIHRFSKPVHIAPPFSSFRASPPLSWLAHSLRL